MDIKKFLQSSYSKENFIEFIYDKFYGFEENDIDYQIPDTEVEQKNIQKYKFLGQVALDDGKEIGFFEFLSTEKVDIENNRVSLNTILKKRVEDELLDGAIAIFYNPLKNEIFRLSFIRFSYDEDNKQQVSNLKRYTYVLGKDIATKTAYSQLNDLKHPSIEVLQDAFGVEKVSKEFFKQYKELYFEISDYLNPQMAYFGSEIKLKLFTKKLLGRIVFLYFLEKKGWLGSDDNWKNGDKKFLTKCFNNEYDKYIQYDNYYMDILQPIFFEALNEKRENDYFEKLKCKMPFLNGGLFSKDEFDTLNIILDNSLFRDIFEIFDSYNFTIIEDSPDDSEIAIDPEMLGRVFEDLLEDRKDKGAYYTPREIVHYMCQKSIINYLLNYFDDITAIEELVFNQSTDNTFIRKNAKAIENQLFNIKVLDPAIGSGAFPMGMLHEIVSVLSNIDKTANIGQLKRKVIENSIYGIDIEQSAVEIAKLRFWLSIVVDEEEPTPLPNLFYKIMVGNSLLETIHGFDPLEKDSNSLFSTDETIIDEIQILLHKFYNAHTNSEKTKIQESIEHKIDDILNKKLDKHNEELKSQLNNINLFGFDKKQTDIIQKLNEDISLTELVKKRPTTELFFYKLYFAEVLNNKGFDVIIGNPPYIKEYTNKSAFNRTKVLECYQGKMDLWYLFACKGIDLLKPNGILSFIATNNWISNFGASKFRNKLLNSSVIKEFIDFGDYKVFDTAGIQTMIMFLQKNISNEKYTCNYSKVINKNLSKNELSKFLRKKYNLKFSIYNSVIIKKDLIDKNITFLESDISSILDKIESNRNFILDKKEEVAQGIVTPNDNVTKQSLETLGNTFELNQGIFNLTTEEKNNLNLSAKELSLIKPLYTSKEIGRYKSNIENEYWIIYTDSSFKRADSMNSYSNLKIHLDKFKKIITSDNKPYGIHRARNEYFFKDEKILSLRKCVNRPVFTYVDFDSYVNQAFYVIKSKRISLKYLTAILNSKLIAFWLKYKGKMQGDNYQVDKEPILDIPIKKIDNTKPFEILVDYIVCLNSLNEPINEYVSNQHITESFEEILDAMVYELYFSNDFSNKNLEFVSYVSKEYKSIEDKKLSEKIEIINQTFSTLKEPYNKIRNNLMLIDTELKEIISYIKKV
ncbi:MAG: Eco57I restriction-modification methylase domain-containing protein [Sulfurimonas sp.]|uniref:Eco57I restriction-modification methylase domain-containing protein n=1 Tax=Sulfurimonas sp. TaxID=2022749 RepID=UPI002639E481|nr:Eco57I restriction-modification methylase domain-containing protein [Sulfurimonas sp.]MDD5400807.1 Eco57I restriction-modification methylase domain-containing protein [Sulfurimonas sp.]